MRARATLIIRAKTGNPWNASWNSRNTILLSANTRFIKKKRVLEKDLRFADEVFTTSSFKDIVPIVKIDNFTINSGKVGRVTKDLMDRLAQYIRLQTI